jgi:lipoate-protein ligase A
MTGGVWRLVDTGFGAGAANMAVDEALLSSYDPARSRPVLRLYGWDPPALSLGRFQQAADVLDLPRCAAAGVPVVRRITGGGVIYHTEELTYSIVCAPELLPPTASIKESFRVLTAFLIRFYARLGLAPRYACDGPPGDASLGVRTPFCFAGREAYDILVAGKKIGGNAQRRMKGAIFQHGSIPLCNRAPEGSRFLREMPAGLDGGLASLRELGITASEAELKGELAAAFGESLGVTLEQEPLSREEREIALRLQREKYADPAWNLHGTAGMES